MSAHDDAEYNMNRVRQAVDWAEAHNDTVADALRSVSIADMRAIITEFECRAEIIAVLREALEDIADYRRWHDPCGESESHEVVIARLQGIARGAAATASVRTPVGRGRTE